ASQFRPVSMRGSSLMSDPKQRADEAQPASNHQKFPSMYLVSGKPGHCQSHGKDNEQNAETDENKRLSRESHESCLSLAGHSSARSFAASRGSPSVPREGEDTDRDARDAQRDHHPRRGAPSHFRAGAQKHGTVTAKDEGEYRRSEDL